MRAVMAAVRRTNQLPIEAAVKRLRLRWPPISAAPGTLRPLRRAIRHLVEIFLVAACIGEPTALAGAADGDTEILIQQIVTAQRPATFYARVEQLVGKASPPELDAYKRHPHHTVSLCAAWEEVRRSVAVPTTETNDDEAYEIVPFRRCALQRFLGVVEGRLRVTPPYWWQSIVGRLETTRKWHGIVRYPDGIVEKLKPYQGPPGEIQVLSSIDVKRQRDGTLELESGGYKYTLPAESLEEAIRTHGRLSENREHIGLTAWLNDDFCVYGFHSFVSWEYSLHCVDRVSGERVWSSNVWSHFHSHMSGAPHLWHMAEIRQQDDTLILFGVDVESVYIEGIALKDGVTRFHFTSAY